MRPGQKIHDLYTIERELGRGGMATVYLAEDLKHKRKVAIKVLHPELAAVLGPDRFLREIQIAARLNHPRILTLIDSDQADGFLYYVMPFVAGGSLRERLTRERELPVADAMRIVQQVGAALDHAHGQNVVHRDIKPENILFHEGEAMVADFGIALAVEQAGGHRLTGTGLALGTPEYMSPEQANANRPLDGRSDIYSLGCVLYEMLVGEPPYTGPTAQAVITKRACDPVPSVGRLRSVAPHIDQALQRALAKIPADRFVTAREFASAIAAAPAPPAGTTPSRSIAVLPFSNLSGDGDSEYFSDGLAEEIINALTGIPSLRVIARTSSFAFKGANEDVRRIGERLGVGAVLEGSARKAGDRLRITVRLVEVSSGYQLWSEKYDRELKDVFAVQDEIAGVVAARLTSALEIPKARRERPTDNLEAYEAFLRARFHWNKGTVDHWEKAAEWFQQAVTLDPAFAQAHIGLAETMIFLAVVSTQGDVLFSQARSAAEEALRLGSGLAEAHAALGQVSYWHDWDFEAAEREFQAALRLNPDSVPALNWYPSYLAALGRGDEGIALSRRALQLDPVGVMTNQQLQYLFAVSGHHAEALQQGRRVLELEPNHILALDLQGVAHIGEGEYGEAVEVLRQAAEISEKGAYFAKAFMAVAHARAGERHEAERIVKDLEDRSRREPASPATIALAHVALGNVDRAFEWIERGIESRDIWLLSLPSFEWWDPVRRDARFLQVMRRMRFPSWSYRRTGAAGDAEALRRWLEYLEKRRANRPASPVGSRRAPSLRRLPRFCLCSAQEPSRFAICGMAGSHLTHRLPFVWPFSHSRIEDVPTISSSLMG
ncbi:MAG: protein kinase [Gemmatimonadetes bacterium]|nr:protein kinase [Gemmatimonadota bacterium]